MGDVRESFLTYADHSVLIRLTAEVGTRSVWALILQGIGDRPGDVGGGYTRPLPGLRLMGCGAGIPPIIYLM